MYVELIHNATLLMALCALYSLLSRLRQRYELWGKICLGLLFGGVAIAGMMMPFQYTPGIIIDGRSIVITLAGLFGGGTTVAIAVLIACIYRALLGGPGMWAGLAIIAATSLVGLFFRRKAGNHPERYGPLSLYGIGIVVHIAMLAYLLLIPWPRGLAVIQTIWLPILLFFPAATMFIGLLFRNEEKRLVTQTQLEKTQELLSKSQAITNVGSWEYDLAEDTLVWSDEVFRIFGIDPEKFTPTYQAFRECVHPDDREAVDSAYTRSVEEGRDGYEIEHRIVRQDTGEIRVVQEKCEHQKDSAGRIVKSIGIVQDITEQKKAEEKLRISEAKFRSLFSEMTEGVYLHEIVYNENGEAVDYRIIDANPASEKILNIKHEDAIGKLATELYGTKEAPYLDIYADVAETRKGVAFEVFFPPMKKHFYISIYCPEKGKFATIFTDITERKKAEEELTKAREYLEHVLSVTPAIVYTMDPESVRLTWVSPNIAAMLGYTPEEVLGSGPDWWKDHLHPEDRDKALAIKEEPLSKGHYLNEYRFRKKDGEYVWIRDELRVVYDAQGNPVEIVGAWSDMTRERQMEEEQQRLEEQLHQAQRLESIGRLAGGVAHDFNNMLSIILGFGENIYDQLRPGDPLREDMKEILEAGKRSAALTRQLLAFSRKQTLQPEVLDLNTLIQDLAKMMQRLIGEDIELKFSLADDLDRVMADPGQIEQVIMNLAVNARDAMPEGGKLILETTNVNLDETYAQDHTGVKPGGYVMLAVTDTGVGMDKETLANVFEPFFTTKEKGKGTGLGLATVYGIVKQSRGHIWAYSEPGKGTTFKIYLPATEAKPESKPVANEKEAAKSGGEHILVVEDEESLRKLMAAMLSRLGYRVSPAANGGEALLLVEEKGVKPDLVLTDVVMPAMSGKELVDRLQRHQPGLKAIFMSGYTDKAIVHNGILDQGMPFIQKPFTLRDIAEKIRTVLLGGQEAPDEP